MSVMKMPNECVTLQQGCDMFIDYCRQRNLREGSIIHYQQGHKKLEKYFDMDMPVTEIDEDFCGRYVAFLKQDLDNDVSINTYFIDLTVTLHYLMNIGVLPYFKIKPLKADNSPIETYTEEELYKLLQKPNLKKCSYLEYQCYVISNLFFSTGIRQRSLTELQVKDVDFNNMILNVRVTKTRKTLLIPLNQTMCNILQEFLRYRQYNSKNDWLFCNAYGNKLIRSTFYRMMVRYNKRRGVETTGVHRYRHTFAKQWVLNGGNVVTLSKLLGHSSLDITQNYINLLISDITKQVDEINLTAKFSNKQYKKLDF